MCGIAGILTRPNDTTVSCQEPLAAMTAALSHRGPDDAGTAVAELNRCWQLLLGHRRLSILDVSQNGHQPMVDPETGSWICYNGEIYNHLELRRSLAATAFRSTSDTETLLRAWIADGPACLERVRGMYAFAIFDGVRRQLWLVRDRLGIKPLYWAQPADDQFLFASEVRALLASGLIPRRLSSRGVGGYLNLGAAIAPDTLVEGITSLLPGQRICIELDRLERRVEWRTECYWSPPFAPEPRPPAENRTQPDVVQLRSVFDDAVRMRFLSDVPVGVFLSGGIDSSAIVASAARQQLDPATYSIAFAEAEYDESEHARAVAGACGVKHTVLRVTAASMLAEFDQALAAYDQPSSDGLNTYTISQAARKAGLKVALSGVGGDELFAGYSTFRRFPICEDWRRRLRMVRGGWADRLAAVVRDRRANRLLALLAAGTTSLDSYFSLRQIFSPREIRVLSGGRSSTDRTGSCRELSARLAGLDAVNAASLLEMTFYLQNVLLRDTDQMAMAHGLEVRVPLLDHALVEQLVGLAGPLKLGANGQLNKWLLVELAGGQLPASATHRKKMGFVFPWARWLRGELAAKIDEQLLDRRAVEAAGLVADAVENVWNQFRGSRGGIRYADILALANLIHWCRANRVQV